MESPDACIPFPSNYLQLYSQFTAVVTTENNVNTLNGITGAAKIRYNSLEFPHEYFYLPLLILCTSAHLAKALHYCVSC